MGATATFQRLMPIVALAVVGCAPLPPAGSVGGLAFPAVRDMPACGVSVRFSGTPEPIPMNILQALHKQYGAHAKWEFSGWRFNKNRLVELALCSCRDFPIRLDDIEKGMQNVTNHVEIQNIGRGMAGDYPGSNGSNARERNVALNLFPNCMIAQSVTAPEPSVAAATFFSTLALMPNAAILASLESSGGSGASKAGDFISTDTITGGTSGRSENASSNNSSQRSVADRLRQLDQLLKDGIISQDERNARRKMILDAL